MITKGDWEDGSLGKVLVIQAVCGPEFSSLYPCKQPSMGMCSWNPASGGQSRWGRGRTEQAPELASQSF